MTDTERVASLIRMIAGDPELRDRLVNANEQDRTAILAELGYADVTPADVAAHAPHAVARVTEVDDDQLSSVAGGGADTSTTAVTTPDTTTMTQGAAVSAAAAT
jgi:hypothetical protein